MNYTASPLAIVIFLTFVALVLGISYYFSNKTKSAKDYYAAGGTIPWAVNGIAFAGDYLSAASFLGICGMIAVYGYDGFLYSIGYLAGWMVALFVVAEPMKRMGKFTFADALDSKFNNNGIKLVAGISTLIVSMFYLIPQMVGAGVLVTPLLGLPHWVGVILVGTIVIIIVATAGMTSTTYVQFLKGGLLIIFSIILVVSLLGKGISTTPEGESGELYHEFTELTISTIEGENLILEESSFEILNSWQINDLWFVKLEKDTNVSIWKVNEDKNILEETVFVTHLADGGTLYNGAPKEEEQFYQVGNMASINGQPNNDTGSLTPFSFIETIKKGEVVTFPKYTLVDGEDKIDIYYQDIKKGEDLLVPGVYYKIDSSKGADTSDKVDFVSLMLALFCGTAALPHILIRYYTVASPAAARKSTIVAIASIGLFYILTLYMGLGAMVSGVVDLTSSNMSAPLLAQSFGTALFAIISAIAFATVLGTVSGLIVASSGAVAHDLMNSFLGIKLSEKGTVRAGKIAAIAVGVMAMILGILFQDMNVSYLVGWAFAVAASANLPAIIMVLFWKKTTAKGVITSVIVGLLSSLGIILLSQKTFNEVYHLVDVVAPMPINNPAIISVPLSFITLVIVSLFTQKKLKNNII